MIDKKRRDLWASLTTPKIAKTSNAVFIMRNIGDIKHLEHLCTLNMHARDQATSEHLQDVADAICQNIFGISSMDIGFEYPENYSDLYEFSNERINIDYQCTKYDEQFETMFLTDDEMIDFFDRFNIDFRNEVGQPLLCTKRVSLVAEAAAKGIAGTMPEIDTILQRDWEAKLAADAERFKKSKLSKSAT